LLDAGADIDIRNNKREQAIQLADLSQNKLIISLIKQHKQKNKLFGVF
jgi:ankyrin repeat protein